MNNNKEELRKFVTIQEDIKDIIRKHYNVIGPIVPTVNIVHHGKNYYLEVKISHEKLPFVLIKEINNYLGCDCDEIEFESRVMKITYYL